MHTSAGHDGSEPLGRLLSKETNVANILAYLCERDPSPILATFGLTAVKPTVHQEVSQGTAGRFDLVVMDNNEPIALVELKVGATQHGDQYARYDAWATTHGNVPCHLITLDEEVTDAPSTWGRHLLTNVLDSWSASPDQPAQVIAAAARDALQDVLDQAAGPLGKAGRTAVAIAFRRLDHLVHDHASGMDLVGGAERTSGGQPALVFYTAHPAALSDREQLCVDLRSEADGKIWKLRLGVEVWLTRDEDGAIVPGSRDRARARAHDLAVGLGIDLRTSALMAHLIDQGHSDLAAMIMPTGGDGLVAGNHSTDALSAWRTAAAAGALTRGGRKLEPHPKFKHDDGRRLVSISHLDYREATVQQLAVLVVTALRYLEAGAATGSLVGQKKPKSARLRAVGELRRKCISSQLPALRR